MDGILDSTSTENEMRLFLFDICWRKETEKDKRQWIRYVQE